MQKKSNRGSSDTDAVRRYVVEHYVRPAKRNGRGSFRVVVGDVHRALGLHNRVPLVCNALSSRKFLEQNSLRIVERTGPPSGQSTTVVLTYETFDREVPDRFAALFRIRGSGKKTFSELGGGENFLRSERSSFQSTLDTESPR
jgi:hypothetical protein